MKKEYLLRILRHRWLQHLLFWGVAWYLLLRLFASSSTLLPIDYIYTSVFLVTLALGVTVNLFVLIPLFLARQHYLLYGFLLPLSVALFTWLNMLSFSRFIDYILPGYYFISYYDYGDLLKFFVVFILITTLLKLSKGWFLLMNARNKLARLEKEHAQAALDLLRQEPIDLIFLDINLPRLSGLNFLKTLERPPMVIFTTAYPEYAVEGFETNAVDYLVKPFSFERFLKAVNKAIEKTRYSQNQSEPQSPDSGKILFY